VIQMTKSMNKKKSFFFFFLGFFIIHESFFFFLSKVICFRHKDYKESKCRVQFSNISEDISVWTSCIVLCFLFLLALYPLLYLFFVIVACLNCTHLLIFF
jgi:hypothetical protein